MTDATRKVSRSIRLEFKPEDLWVGLFWRRSSAHAIAKEVRALDVWVCIVPMLPIHYRKVTSWETCYEFGQDVAWRKFERHGRAGAVHLACVAE